MKTIIITDGKYRSAITAARTLGGAGWHVVVTQTRQESRQDPPVFSSRSVAAVRWIKGSCKDARYPQRLLRLLREYENPVLLCIGADSLNAVSGAWESFAPHCAALIAPPAVLDALNDKEAVHRRAQELGLAVPEEFSGEPERYPVVIKPHCGEKFGLKAQSRYAIAQNPTQFAARYAAMAAYDPNPIVQEKVEGDGAGVSLLLGREGELLGAICHRRIREYPVSGGPSTCCVSFYDEGMIADAHRLLRSFGFTGLAMVEFKGKYILEVNPRIWGSFPMTGCAGSPLLLRYAAAAVGEHVEYRPRDYRTDVRMRFLLNDTLAIMHYLKSGKFAMAFEGIADMVRAKEALWDRKDPAPFWAYLKTTLGGK